MTHHCCPMVRQRGCLPFPLPYNDRLIRSLERSHPIRRQSRTASGITRSKELETKTPYYPNARERLSAIPFPCNIDKSLERGPQIRQSTRTAYGIVYYDAPLLSHGEAERLSTIPPPLQQQVDSITRKRPSNSPAVEDSFRDYQIKRTRDQDPLLSKGEGERLSAIPFPCNGRPNR